MNDTQLAVENALRQWIRDHGEAPAGQAWSVRLNQDYTLKDAILVNLPGFPLTWTHVIDGLTRYVREQLVKNGMSESEAEHYTVVFGPESPTPRKLITERRKK